MTVLSFDVLWNDRGAQRGMHQLGDTTERTQKRFTGLKVAGAAALVAVGAAAVRFGTSSVKAYVEAEQSQARLSDAYRKFPKVADVSLASLQRLNSELAKKTKFDDDATASGQAVLAQFNLTGRQITQLTPLLQDYAAKTGKDLPTAARDLGKAVMGQGRALKNVGLDLKDTGTATGNLDQLMGGLRSQVGGFAEREGKTAAGRFEILKNQAGELQEAAGQRLLPALLKVGNGLLTVVDYVQDANGVFGSFRRITEAAMSGFSDSVGNGRSAFRVFSDYVSTHQAGVVRVFVEGGKAAIGLASAIVAMASGALRGMGELDQGVSRVIMSMIRDFGGVVRAAAHAFSWVPGIGPKLEEADRKFAAWTSSVEGHFASQGRGATAAADKLDNSLRPALDRAGRKLDEVGRKEIVKAQTRDAVRKAALAVDAIGTSASGAQVKLKRFSDISSLAAGEQQQLRSRLNDARSALVDKITTMRRAGASQDDLSRAVKRGENALYKEFRQMGLSREEARKLARQYSAVPGKIRTDVSAPGAKKARDDVRDVDKAIEQTNGKSVGVNVGIKFSPNKLAASMIKGDYFNNPGAFSGGSMAAMANHPQVGPRMPRPNAWGGPTPHEAPLTVDVGSNSPKAPFNRLVSKTASASGIAGVDYAESIGEKWASSALKKYKATQAKWERQQAAKDGSPGGKVSVTSRGMAGTISAMRARGARSFTTYPGHHPSMAKARDVTPHNWAIANAARASSSVWYVIYRMRIASKNHGNSWRPYRPTNFRGDWRHVNHVHVAWYAKGGKASGPTLSVLGERGPERVLTPKQTDAYERAVRLAERGGGATVIHNHYSFPHYVGSRSELRQALVEMNRYGQLDVLKR